MRRSYSCSVCTAVRVGRSPNKRRLSIPLSSGLVFSERDWPLLEWNSGKKPEGGGLRVAKKGVLQCRLCMVYPTVRYGHHEQQE